MGKKSAHPAERRESCIKSGWTRERGEKQNWLFSSMGVGRGGKGKMWQNLSPKTLSSTAGRTGDPGGLKKVQNTWEGTADNERNGDWLDGFLGR